MMTELPSLLPLRSHEHAIFIRSPMSDESPSCVHESRRCSPSSSADCSSP